MSALICSFDGLHDNRVLRYYADFEATSCTWIPRPRPERSIRSHYWPAGHWFENVVQDNILFGMDEISVDAFLNRIKTC